MYRYKDGSSVNLLPSYGTRINIMVDGSLVISTVEKEDMGWYQCRPSNGIGQDPEAMAFLNVTCKFHTSCSFVDFVNYCHFCEHLSTYV